VSQNLEAALGDISLPIGWDSRKVADRQRYDNRQPATPWEVAWVLARTGLGWLITGVAVAMGAPFWFDLLGKIMRVKNTGRNNPSS
jgi:hypothetical protein